METSQEAQHILKKALDMSKQMLTLAEHQEWQNMEALMKERDTLLSQINGPIDAQILPNESKAAIADLFSQIKQIQSQVHQIAEQTHQQNMKEIKASNTHKKAVKSYQAHR